MFGWTRVTIKALLDAALKNEESPFTATTTFEDRVYMGEAIAGAALPNVVYRIEQDGQYKDGQWMSGATVSGPRIYNIIIEIRDTISDTIEYRLDNNCYEVETSMANATALNSMFDSLLLESTEFEVQDAEEPYGIATLTYRGIVE